MGWAFVRDVLFVPGYDLLIKELSGGQFRVFSRETEGKPNIIFDHHYTEIVGIIHLFEDVVASLDETGNIITWHASSGSVLSQMQTERRGSNNFAKREYNSLVFSDISGNIHVVSHTKGEELKHVLTRHLRAFSRGTRIAVHGGVCITYVNGFHRQTPNVWDSYTFEQVSELNAVVNCCRVAMNDDLIVGAAPIGIYIYTPGVRVIILSAQLKRGDYCLMN